MLADTRDIDLAKNETGLPAMLEELIFTIRDKYAYLYQ
jgi:hypothetical protein